MIKYKEFARKYLTSWKSLVLLEDTVDGKIIFAYKSILYNTCDLIAELRIEQPRNRLMSNMAILRTKFVDIEQYIDVCRNLQEKYDLFIEPTSDYYSLPVKSYKDLESKLFDLVNFLDCVRKGNDVTAVLKEEKKNISSDEVDAKLTGIRKDLESMKIDLSKNIELRLSGISNSLQENLDNQLGTITKNISTQISSAISEVSSSLQDTLKENLEFQEVNNKNVLDNFMANQEKLLDDRISSIKKEFDTVRELRQAEVKSDIDLIDIKESDKVIEAINNIGLDIPLNEELSNISLDSMTETDNISSDKVGDVSISDLDDIFDDVLSDIPSQDSSCKQSLIEQERLTKEKEEQERLAKEKEEQERLAKEREEQERLARKKEEQERLTKERLAKEKAEQEKLAKEKAEQERLAKEKAEREEQERLRREEEQRRFQEEQQLRMLELQKKKEEEERLRLDAIKRAEEERLRIEREEQERLKKVQEEKENTLDISLEDALFEVEKMSNKVIEEFKSKQESDSVQDNRHESNLDMSSNIIDRTLSRAKQFDDLDAKVSVDFETVKA